MITIPLYYALFAYFFFLALFSLLFLVNIGHLARTGTFTLLSFFVTLLFTAITIFTLWVTWKLLAGTNWQTPITVWNNAWLGNTFGSDQIARPFP